MDFEYIEKNIIHKYWETLSRKNILNLQINKFIKKPYIENYIIELSNNIDQKILEKKILELLECNKITNEEIFLFINNIIEISIENKKIIEKFLFKNESNNECSDIYIEIINYQIKYFRFYNTIIELLFDDESENNELYNFILIFIKDKKREINNYSKKNIKFKIFYYYLCDLYVSFESLIKLLVKYELFIEVDKKETLNLFIKNIFTNWYNIYRKDILENKVNDKIKDYNINRSILSRILCLPNA
jgi:hypothetical protein